MAASLLLERTKPTAVDDPDPTLGFFTPPEVEVFKPSSQASGFRLGLVYAGGPGFTATVNVFARDALTKTWYRAATQGTLGHRVLFSRCNTGAHDLWVGLTAVTGGAPIQIRIEEVD